MRVIVSGDSVEVQGDVDKDGNGSSHSMSVEQFAKHARDPQFAARANAAATAPQKAALASAVAALADVP